MQFTKMNLSNEERAVLGNKEFFLIKRNISEKFDTVFSEMQSSWMREVSGWNLPVEGIDRTRGKIFKGENYRLFPYTIMDFPRHFSKEAVFAVRTMCWWGHECSVTLHIQGKALAIYQTNLEDRLSRMSIADLYFCINDTPWEYHYETDNYVSFSQLTFSAMVHRLNHTGFLKLSYRIPLEKITDLEELGENAIKNFGVFLS
ncbi:MAG: hypothetical protein RIQ47_973 [Bacteroidota bacterium]